MMTPENKYSPFSLRNIFNVFIFEYFFISLCSCAMVFTSCMVYGSQVKFTPYTFFITASTFLVYNLHRISFLLNYSGYRAFFDSIKKSEFPVYQIVFLVLSAAVAFFFYFQLNTAVKLILLLPAFLTMAYSFPLISRKNKRFRLMSVSHLKTPLVAMIWGFSTSFFPVFAQNMNVSFSFMFLQVLSVCFFIFVLCIPFEIRDIEKDKINGINSLAVVLGKKRTQITGTVIVILEIILHHLMPVKVIQSLALDVSSLVALLWIIVQKEQPGKYFYNGWVDGTMMIRFLLVLTATNLA